MKTAIQTNNKTTLKMNIQKMMIHHLTAMKRPIKLLFLCRKMSIFIKNMACFSVESATISCNRMEPKLNFLNSDAEDAALKTLTSKIELETNVLFTVNHFNKVKI